LSNRTVRRITSAIAALTLGGISAMSPAAKADETERLWVTFETSRGSSAMARTSDPHSATAQFFINVVDNDFLNHCGRTAQRWGYTAFGRVVEGMDTVDRIAAGQTGSRGMFQDVPQDTVVIQKTRIH